MFWGKWTESFIHVRPATQLQCSVRDAWKLHKAITTINSLDAAFCLVVFHDILDITSNFKMQGKIGSKTPNYHPSNSDWTCVFSVFIQDKDHWHSGPCGPIWVVLARPADVSRRLDCWAHREYLTSNQHVAQIYKICTYQTHKTRLHLLGDRILEFSTLHSTFSTISRFVTYSTHEEWKR